MPESKKRSLKSVALAITTQMQSTIKTCKRMKTWKNENMTKWKREEMKRMQNYTF